MPASQSDWDRVREWFEIHVRDELHPDGTLDGHFEGYLVRQEFPLRHSALMLLRTLACIVAPLMKRHNITIHAIGEVHPMVPMLGVNTDAGFDTKTCRYKTIVIGLRLRYVQDVDRFLPLEELLGTLCHELAHCWYGDHNTNFFRKWKALIDELEEDMGNRIRIPLYNLGGRSDYAKILRLLQWEVKEVSTKEPTTRSKPNRQSMDAAWKWEKWYWDYTKMLVRLS